MDLDGIQDIEVLRSALKKLLSKCIATVEIKDCLFEEDNWYFVVQDEGSMDIFDDNFENITTVTYEEAKQIFG